MRYCIIYALTNMWADEKISVGLVCQAEKGWTYRFSDRKISISQNLLPKEPGEYVRSFVSGFEEKYMEGKSSEAILSSLETLRKYSNNYVIFSPIKDLTVQDSSTMPEKLYLELINPTTSL